MNHDAKRATGPGAGGERHAIGVTSMCLRSGSVQLPFALAGRLPEGELLVHDVESDEALVLWSEPPRRLAGLGPLFERHEVQVNDQLVLDLHGDDVRIAVAKRPRRSRPKVTPSAWSSHRDEPPRRTPAAEPATDPEGDPERGPADQHAADGPPAAPRPERGGRGVDDLEPPSRDRPGGPAGGRASRPGAPDEREPAGGELRSVPDDEAPRAPRVRVKPLPWDVDVTDAADATDATPDETATAVAPPRERRGPLAGLMRAARGWLGGTEERRRRRHEPAPADADDEPDWTHAWQGTDADDDEAAETVFETGRYGEPVSERDPERDPQLEPERLPPRSPEPDGAPLRSLAGRAEPRERPAARPERSRAPRTEPSDAAATPEAGAHDETAPSPTRSDEPSSSGPTLPSGVPLRAERFLGGDLRTRLVRFLASPEMPLIAKTELIAKRFDLDLDTARDMLEDVAEDPPDGLRLTPVRDGAWRIERTGS